MIDRPPEQRQHSRANRRDARDCSIDSRSRYGRAFMIARARDSCVLTRSSILIVFGSINQWSCIYLRVRVVSIESSLGASRQVLHVQEELIGAVQDSRSWRRSDDGVASERADVHDLSMVVSASLSSRGRGPLSRFDSVDERLLWPHMLSDPGHDRRVNGE